MKSNNRRKPKGFYHSHSLNSIKWYRSLSPKMKLEWLEEVNSFLYNNASKKIKNIWQKFRKAEI